MPSAAVLDGTVTDDGEIQPFTSAWTQISGPGTATFADASAVDTSATFSVDGVYVLRLTADDGEHVVTDDVTITVDAANIPPTVSAGPDLAVSMPNAAVLDATVTDDGEIQPVAITWVQVSGPGTTTFADPNVVDTTATFSIDGVYVLRLSADDGEFVISDDVTVTVNPVNTAPTVDVGVDQAVTLPAGITLDATTSDDGQITPLTFLWSQQSGPDAATFADATAEDTTATFSADGVYVLRLTVNDGEFASFDELTVTVDPQSGVTSYSFDSWPAGFTTHNAAAVPNVGVRDGRYYADVLDNSSEQTLWWASFQSRSDGSLHDLPVQVTARGAGVAPLGDDTTPLPFSSGDYAFAALVVHDEDPNIASYLSMSVGHRGKPNTIQGSRTNTGSSGNTDLGSNVHTGRVDLRLIVNADGTHTAYWQPAGTSPDNWQLYNGTGLLRDHIPGYSSTRVWVSLSGSSYLNNAVPFTAVFDSLEIEEL